MIKTEAAQATNGDGDSPSTIDLAADSINLACGTASGGTKKKHSNSNLTSVCENHADSPSTIDLAACTAIAMDSSRVLRQRKTNFNWRHHKKEFERKAH